jgi:diacylglycerol kinase family enzyme
MLDLNMAERTISGKVFMAVASVNRFFGGGMLVAPDARFDDGLFDVTVVDEISLPELLLNIRKLFDGTLPSYRKVYTLRTAAIEVSGPQAAQGEADGELIGPTPMRFSLLPRHIRVVVP